MEKEITQTLPARMNRTETVHASNLGAIDLSAEIARAVERQPGDRVKCRRVSSTTYRCNWFTPDRGGQGETRVLESYRIRQSRFLRATKTDGQLTIEDITGRN